MQTPPSVPEDFKPDLARAEQIIDDALGERREWLTEPESKALMQAYGIPIVDTRVADTPQRAALVASAVGLPVAIKILSPDITHKSDVGGVELQLETPEAVEEAAKRMLARVKATRPDAHVEGFTVQPMLSTQGSHELILGMTTDQQFGPVMLFGAGAAAA
jgi:acetyltransferase